MEQIDIEQDKNGTVKRSTGQKWDWQTQDRTNIRQSKGSTGQTQEKTDLGNNKRGTEKRRTGQIYVVTTHRTETSIGQHTEQRQVQDKYRTRQEKSIGQDKSFSYSVVINWPKVAVNKLDVNKLDVFLPKLLKFGCCKLKDVAEGIGPLPHLPAKNQRK